MWRSAVSKLLLAVLIGCTSEVPDYSALRQASTREELRSRFGQPDSIESGIYHPDVVSINEPPLKYTHFEYWEYISTNDGEMGRAFFSFYVNDQNSAELLGDMNWLSDEELSFIRQR